MRDTIAVGTLAGVVAVIAYEIVDWLITGSFGGRLHCTMGSRG